VVDADFITGLGTLNDRMLILIEIERLMAAADMALAEQAA
jgi:purine-binding chemotaxis protein CheW